MAFNASQEGLYERVFDDVSFLFSDFRKKNQVWESFSVGNDTAHFTRHAVYYEKGRARFLRV